jgi:hypothetical protein
MESGRKTVGYSVFTIGVIVGKELTPPFPQERAALSFRSRYYRNSENAVIAFN